MRHAVERGPTAVRRLSQRTLFLWLGKVFYGFLYREHLLSADRANPASGSIIERADLLAFRTHHGFVQAARFRISFRNFFPASIFVFRCQMPRTRGFQFDCVDFLPRLGIALRLGTVGIVAILQDGGATRKYLDHIWRVWRRRVLHRSQFLEAAAIIFDAAKRMNRTPKYISSDSKSRIIVIQMPIAGLSLKPVFDDFDLKEYSKMLAYVFRVPQEVVYCPPDGVRTWIRDDSGRFRTMTETE